MDTTSSNTIVAAPISTTTPVHQNANVCAIPVTATTDTIEYKTISRRFLTHPNNSRPWEVARWGRLLSGVGVCLFGILGIMHHPNWLLGTILIAVNLILTSLTDRCAMRDSLIKLGAREREDLFLPGGQERGPASKEDRSG